MGSIIAKASRVFLNTNIKEFKKASRTEYLDVCQTQFLGTLIGESKMHYLQEVKKWLGEITEILLLLVALGVVVEILFGAQVTFFGGVVANLTGLIGTFGEDGLVGLIALGVILYLFQRGKIFAQQHQQ